LPCPHRCALRACPTVSGWNTRGWSSLRRRLPQGFPRFFRRPARTADVQMRHTMCASPHPPDPAETPPDPDLDLMTSAEVAAVLRCTPRTATVRLLAAGVPRITVSRKLTFWRRSDVVAFLRGPSPTAPPATPAASSLGVRDRRPTSARARPELRTCSNQAAPGGERPTNPSARRPRRSGPMSAVAAPHPARRAVRERADADPCPWPAAGRDHRRHRPHLRARAGPTAARRPRLVDKVDAASTIGG
jgi:hypothetical protein